MYENMANIIRFTEKPSPWSLTVKLGDFRFSCIVGVAEPVNEIGKRSFWNTLLDTRFLVDPYYPDLERGRPISALVFSCLRHRPTPLN